MRIAIFGSGGIGGYIGARLDQIGKDVILIARGAHLKTIQQHGLKIESPKGNFVSNPKLVTDDPSQVGVVDAILLGVKAWHIPEVAHTIQPMIGPETAVITLQNGVDTPSKLAAVLGPEQVVIGLAILRCFITNPGHLRHTVDLNPNVQIGEMTGNSLDRVKNLGKIFEQAGLTVKIPEDIHAAMWGKFLLFSVMSGLGTITRSTTEIWRTLPETRQIAKESLRESAAVAKSNGVNLSDSIVEDTMRLIDNMADGHTTSMATDIMAGRPSELEAAIGHLVRLGQELGIDTPITSLIYNSLLPQEIKARK